PEWWRRNIAPTRAQKQSAATPCGSRRIGAAAAQSGGRFGDLLGDLVDRLAGGGLRLGGAALGGLGDLASRSGGGLPGLRCAALRGLARLRSGLARRLANLLGGLRSRLLDLGGGPGGRLLGRLLRLLRRLAGNLGCLLRG